MGIMSNNQIKGNNCFINNSISMNGNEWQTSHQNISLIQRQSSQEWAQVESVIDMNPIITINANDLNNAEPQQQILIVSSPMDLMTAEAIQKSSPVQMVLSELPLMSNTTQLNVIQVPTNLLLADNNLIVIPQEGITLEVPTMETSVEMANDVSQSAVNYQNKTWLTSTGLVVQPINGFANNTELNQIGLVSVTDNANNANYFHNNNQLFGIIDDQTHETKLVTANINPITNEIELNPFITSSPETTPECGPNEAKQWHNDSVIAYRALMAFKKVMPNKSSVSTK